MPSGSGNIATLIEKTEVESELKNNIPYFVLGEPNLDDPNVVKNHEHYVFVPGVINADKRVIYCLTHKNAAIYPRSISSHVSPSGRFLKG